jgi:Calx-beta domain
VPPTTTLNLQAYATGTHSVEGNPGAWDTVPSDTQSQPEYQATTQRRLGAFNPWAVPALPRVSFSAANYGVWEAAATAPITVSVVPTSTKVISVTVATADGNAGPADYVAVSQVLTFTPGPASQIVPVHILIDTVAEPDETVLFSLSQPVYAQLAQPFTATLAIHDSPPVLVPNKLFLPFLRK